METELSSALDALKSDPANPEALESIARKLGSEKRWTDLAKVYDGAIRAVKRGPAEIPLLIAAGQLFWKELGQNDQAELYFRRVKKAQPVHPAVIEFYRAYHTDRNEIPQLMALLGQAQKAEADLETRIRLGIELAELAEKRPQSLEKAIDAWKALLRLRPGLPEATAALRRLYTKTEKWNAYLELLKDDLDALPPAAVDDKVARYLEMIPIYRDRLRLEVMVINVYVAILALKPDHAEALTALAERYETQGRWGDLVQVFTRQADASSDPALKVSLYHRVAQLWSEKFNKHQNAVAALEKVLQVAPGDERARAALRDIFTRGRSWKGLLDLMRRELPLQDRARRRIQLAEMARLAMERLSEARLAIGLWNEVLAEAPRDAEALTALAGLYEREKRWPALAEVLARQGQAADEAARAPLLERRGVLLYEKLGARGAAVEDLQRALALAPQGGRALRMLRDIHAEKGDLAALEALYGARGAYGELCDVLAGMADRTSDLAARTRILERVATLSETALQQPERALKSYEKILATDPENRAAARAAAALYRSTERWGRLLATYEILLGPDPLRPRLPLDEALVVLGDARWVCEQKLGSKALAFQWCARAYGLAPDDGVLAELERLAEEADEWAALSALLERRVAEAGTDERLGLLRRLARIALTRLNRLTELRRFAEAILALVPLDPEAESALQQVFVRTENWPELVTLLRARTERVADPDARAEMLLRIARIEEEKMGNRAAAAGTLQRVIELDPGNTRALAALVRAVEATGDWSGLAAGLKRQIELCSEEERPALLLRLGRLLETELGDPGGARAAYQRVLEADSISAEAVAGLERLLAAGEILSEEVPAVYARLVPYYELTESYEKWARALEVLIDAASGEARTPHLEMLTHLYAGPLGDPQAGARVATRLFELEPANFAHRDRLLQLAVEAQGLDELALTVRRVLASVDDAVLRRDLLGYLADIEDRRPGQGGASEAAFREILELDPLHFGAFRSLTRLYRDAERWQDLRDLLVLRQAHIAEPKDRVELLAQVAEIDESLLEDRAHTISTLQTLIELDPGELRFWRALDRQYAATERWRDLDELLARLVAIAPPGEVRELALRRADVLFTRFGEAGVALDLLEDVLESEPERTTARALVERMLDVPAERQRAARVLEPIYEAAGNWPRLVSVLQVQREAREGDSAVEVLMRIAEIQEQRLQSRLAALGTWHQVLKLDPWSSRGLIEYERLATLLERFAELVEVYQDLARRRDRADLSGAAALYARAARLYMARFEDREGAIRAWRQVLDLDSTNRQTAEPAAEALEALYTDAGDHRGLVEVLRVKVDWAEDPTERRALLLHIAGVEEKLLGDAPAAVATYRTLLESDGEEAAALDHLERIFEATGQHRERAEILRRRVDLATDAATRRELRYRIAALLEREMGDVDEAVSMFLGILDEAPEDRGALHGLARLYEKQGATAERIEVLERQLVVAGSPAERVELLRQVAELLQGPLERPGEALDRWREILSLSPRDPIALAQLERLLGQDDAHLRGLAAQILEPIYEALGEWQKLAGVLQVHIQNDEDAGERMGYRVRLAALQEARLADRPAAFASYAAAIRDGLGEPLLPRLLDEYERVGSSLGGTAMNELVALYRAVEPDVLDERVRARLQGTIATHAEKAGDLDAAAEHYAKVLDRSPDDPAVLVALERVYRQAGRTDALYDVVQRRAELAVMDPGAERALRLEAGALASSLSHPEEAMAAYERVWSLAPGDPEASAALEKLYLEGERWSDLVGLLERRLGAGLGNWEAVALRFRLAQIELDRLGNRERALAHLGGVLQAEPDHPEAIESLEALLADEELQEAVADLLEPVYVRRSAWPRLVAIDEIRLRRSDDPDRRFACTARIARIYEEQIEDLDEAFRWYGRVFRERPTDRGVQEQLLRLAPRLGRWRELAEWVDTYLEDELGNGDEILPVVRLAAWIQDEALGDREKARQHYRRFVEAQPGDLRASAVFEQALERWEAWGELRDHLDEQAARVASAEERATLLRRSARVSEEKLAATGDAIVGLRALLEIDPSDARVAEDLERLLRQEENWEDLRDHLLSMLERQTETYVQDALTIRLAEVERDRLGDFAAAVDRFGEVLARTPGHPVALTSLEALLDHPDQKLRAAEILEPLYRRNENVWKLSDILEIRLEAESDPEARVSLLREIAAIEERLGRFEKALEARARAWLADVGSGDTLAELEALATATRRFERFAEVLAQGAEEASDPDLRASLCGMRAKILESRLAAPEAAADAWRAVLSARLDDAEAFLALERLLASAGQSAELCETLERHVEVVTDAGERKALTKRIAILYEQALKERDKAVDAWRTVLDIDDGDDEALEALARLYVAGAAWRSLAEVYQRKIELASDPQTVRHMRFMSARLHDERLEEPFEAASQLRAVLDTHPSDVEALAMLDAIFTREERHAELLEVLDWRAQAESAPGERDAFAFRAASLLERDLSDVPAAVERYRELLSRSPQHGAAREALWALARQEDHRALAASVLEPVLRAAREWEPLIELLELRLASEEAVGLRIEILGEIARIEEEERREPDRALEAWRRAFAEEPGDAAIRESLERLTALQGGWARLARTYEEPLGSVFDADLQQWLAGRLAEIHEQHLGDPERAVGFWGQVREASGDDPRVLARLETLLHRLGRDREREEVLGRQAELAGDPAEQADFWAALGELRWRRLDNLEGAIEAYRAAVDRLPTHAAALSALREMAGGDGLRAEVLDVLEPLAEGRGDYGEMVALYTARLRLEDEPHERAARHRRIADLFEQHLNDLPQALDALGEALREDPLTFQTADEIERVALALHRPADGARRLEASLDRLEDAALAEMALRTARLYSAAGSTEEDAALKLYGKVLEVDPESAPALEALEALHRRRGETAPLARILERRGAVALEPERRSAFLAEAARLHETRGDLEAALAAWAAVREGDEANREALTELARLHERQGRFPDLVGILEEEARFTDDPSARAALFLRIGEIKGGALNDADGAAEALREAVDLTPEDPAALAALVAAEERRGDASALEEALLRSLSATSGQARIACLFRLAEHAARKLDDPDRALSYLHQVTEIEPRNRQALAEMERHLGALERWHDLIEVLERRAAQEAAAGDGEAELACRAAVAEIWGNRLGEPENALETLQEILARNPAHVPSLLAVARVHQAAERWPEARAALEQASASAFTGPERAEIHFRLGEIAAAEGAPPDEVETQNLAALENDPSHAGALAALETLARAAGNEHQLVQILSLRERLIDGEQRKALLNEIGQLHMSLGQPGEAVAPLEALAALAPADPSVQESLGKALAAAGRVEEGEGILSRLLEHMTKARQNKAVARLQQLLGSLAEARGDLALAEQRLTAAYQIDPTQAATLASLGRLALRRNDAEKARRFFRSLLLHNFDERAVGITKAEVYLALGRLHLAAGEVLKARNMFERGLESDPRNSDLKKALAELPR